MKTLEELDLELIWHPCSQMKDYETLPPIVVDHGQGCWLYDIHGNKYLDVVSSWWCNLLGHCNPDINAAIKEQVDKLEHVIFANFTHKPIIELVQRLIEIVPNRIKKFHFNDNGSAAIECALKTKSSELPKPKPDERFSMTAIFPFSKQGVTFAITISPSLYGVKDLATLP